MVSEVDDRLSSYYLQPVIIIIIIIIICSKSPISLQRGPVDLTFQVEGVTPTNHSISQTRLNVFFFIWCKNPDRSFFSFVTIHAFDRQM